MHGLSALKIANKCRIASGFIEGLVINLRGPDTMPLPELFKHPPDIHRVKAVVELELEYVRVTVCMERVTESAGHQKQSVLNILTETNREIRWILYQWNT